MRDFRNSKYKYPIMLALIAAFIIYGLVQARHFVTVSNPTGSQIRVEAHDAREGDGGVAYLEVGEGQSISFVVTDMDSGSLYVEVFPYSEDAEGDIPALYTETFREVTESIIGFEPGEYAVRATAVEGTTAKMTIQPAE